MITPLIMALAMMAMVSRAETIQGTFDLKDLAINLKDIPEEYIEVIKLVAEYGNPFMDFLKGFKDGVWETMQMDIDLAKDCFYGVPDSYKLLIHILENIIHFDFHDWKDELQIIIGDLMNILGDLIPCLFTYKTIAGLVVLIIHPSLHNLEYHILINLSAAAQLIFNDLIDILVSLFKLNFYNVGGDLGQILYLLIR